MVTKKVKEILWDENINSPIFVLEDGRKFRIMYEEDASGDICNAYYVKVKGENNAIT